MTEKLYVGTLVDVQSVRTALDFLYSHPVPGINAQTGQPIVDTPTRDAMRVDWFNYSQGERDAIVASPGSFTSQGHTWSGWSLQWSELVVEPSPGIRRACWIPTTLTQLVQDQAALGRTLSIAQASACAAANLLAIADFPPNWVQTD